MRLDQINARRKPATRQPRAHGVITLAVAGVTRSNQDLEIKIKVTCLKRREIKKGRERQEKFGTPLPLPQPRDRFRIRGVDQALAERRFFTELIRRDRQAKARLDFREELRLAVGEREKIKPDDRFPALDHRARPRSCLIMPAASLRWMIRQIPFAPVAFTSWL